MLSAQKKQNKYWLAFGLSALGAAMILLPFAIVDKGYFLYAGDYNSQQIPFYYYANKFLKDGGGSFSWATDLGSGFVNSYSYYLVGSPFWWLSLLFPAAAQPYLMIPFLVLRFAVAGGGAELWLRRWVKDENLAVLGGLLYAFSGFSIYNIFFYFFVDVVALFPYFLWSLDEAVLKKRRGLFAVLAAVNLLNNYFFFAGQVVFLAVYFVCMLSVHTYRVKWKDVGRLAIESVLGCGMGCILAVPALLFLSGNPRTVNPFSGFGFLLYSQPQQYASILYNLFFPPDCPYMPVIFNKGVIKWTSLSAYLPLVSFAGVWAYLRCKQGTAFKRILYTCLFMAFVPVLNSAFYALNSSYYARWFYMPVLVMCAATVKAMEDEDVAMEKGFVPTILSMLAFAAFALVPVEGETEADGWTIGVMEHPEKFWLNLGFAILGVSIFWLIWLGARRRPVLARRMCAAVLAFSCVVGITHIAIGKFAQWENDDNVKSQQYQDGRALAEWLPEGAYRVTAYGCHDNMGLWMDRSCIECFHSTVSPSIMEFYPKLGVKRDVRSEPDADMNALRCLLGVRYAVCPWGRAKELEKDMGNQWIRWGEKGDLVIYENTLFLPMAFAYDKYVTFEDYEDTVESRRDELLLRALVLDEEQIEEYGDRLEYLPKEERSDLDPANIEPDCARRSSMAAQNVVTDSRGISAEIWMDSPNLLFFSVPYDKGFDAKVNGQEAPVLKVSGGMIAVPVEEGHNAVRLEYHTPGLKFALSAAGVSLLLYGVYMAVSFKGRRKRREELIKE